MSMMMILSIGFAGLNTILLLILLTIYFANYKKIKAEFNLGLFLFALVFLIQKITTIILYITTMMPFAAQVETAMFILEILQTIAFMVLVWITMK